MSITVVHPHHVFGASVACCRQAVGFANQQTVVYPAGVGVVLYDVIQHTQKVVFDSDRCRPINAMAVSPSRQYVAIAQLGDDVEDESDLALPIIVIYDLQLSRKCKILSTKTVQSKAFVSMAFSPDSKYLVTLGGEPDWALTYWTWKESKVMASTHVVNPLTGGPVEEVSFSPHHNTKVCVVGNGTFLVYRYFHQHLRLTSTQKVDFPYFTCHTWTSEDHIVAGTADGGLMLFVSGDWKADYYIETQQQSDGQIETAQTVDLSLSSSSESEVSVSKSWITELTTKLPVAITAIASFSKGFACACGLGFVHFFDVSDDDRKYFHFIRTVSIAEDSFSYFPEKSWKQAISSLAVSPSDESLVCSTSANRLYAFTLSNIDSTRQVKLKAIAEPFHSHEINGVDVCIRKPLIVTCSKDKSVRLWNYSTNRLDLYKEFLEDCHSVAIHPSGHYILVGFSDKLRLMNILIDDLRTFFEIAFRSSSYCCFSNGGHMLAATNGNSVDVISTTTFETVCSLKGHRGRVTGIEWFENDYYIATSGAGGMVCYWEVLTGKPIGENVNKNIGYNGIAMSKEKMVYFAIGTDNKLRKFEGSQIVQMVEIPQTTMTAIVHSHSGRSLFAGTSNGKLLSFRFPLSEATEWADRLVHSDAVKQVKCTHDETYVITASKDSCVVMWKIKHKDGHGHTKRHESMIAYTEEVLITRSDLAEKNTAIIDLKNRVDDLKLDSEYQLSKRELECKEKVNELTEKWTRQKQLIENKFESHKTQSAAAESKYKSEIVELLEKHAQGLDEVELIHGQKIMLEYEKYDELQEKSRRMQEDYELQMSETIKKSSDGVQELVDYYEAKILDNEKKIEQLSEMYVNYATDSQGMMTQMEEDADREAVAIKRKFENAIAAERKVIELLKGDGRILTSRVESLGKELEQQRAIEARLHSDIAGLNNTIRQMEKDMVTLKKDVDERDTTIKSKERRIYELKTKNQELEKFKFVLDYKITDLKAQLEPKESEIRQMKEQISKMEYELDKHYEKNNILQHEVNEELDKRKAIEHEMIREKAKVRELTFQLKRVQNDIYKCAGLVQEPEALKESIRMIFLTHVHEDFNPDAASSDTTHRNEHQYQREHLEKTIAALIKRLASESKQQREENAHAIQENVFLIRELNDLRSRLREVRKTLAELSEAFGLHRRNIKLSPTELLAMISEATKNAQMERELIERRRMATVQTYELLKARNEMAALEKTAVDVLSLHDFRPASANDAGFWPGANEDPKFFFPPIKGLYRC